MSVARFLRNNYDVVASALVALLVCTVAISATPLPTLVSDAYMYTMSAERLVRDGTYAISILPPGSDVASNALVTPGHILMLAKMYALVGRSGTPEDAVRTVQPMLVAVQVILVMLTASALAFAGRQLGGRRLGLAAGVLAALYLPFAWAASVALAECLGVALLSVQIAWGIRLASGGTRRRTWEVFAFGALTGLSILVRPSMVLWAFVAPAYVALSRVERPKRLAVLLAAGVAGAVLVMAPWWVRNAVVIGKWVPLRTNLVRTASGYEVIGEDLSGLLEAPAKMGPRTLAYVISQPWSAPADVLWENANNPNGARIDFGTFESALKPGMDRAVRVLRFYHVALLALALLGAAFTVREPRLLIALAMPVATIASHWSTQLTPRYFILGMPGVILAAAFAVVGLARLAGRRRVAAAGTVLP